MRPVKPWIILGVILAFTGISSYAVWERGEAVHWHGQYSALQATYNGAAAKAAADATAETNRRWQALQTQQQQATVTAEQKAQAAQSANTTYQAKLAALAKQYSDLGHRCAVTVQPLDTVPGK